MEKVERHISLPIVFSSVDLSAEYGRLLAYEFLLTVGVNVTWTTPHNKLADDAIFSDESHRFLHCVHSLQ